MVIFGVGIFFLLLGMWLYLSRVGSLKFILFFIDFIMKLFFFFLEVINLLEYVDMV